MVDDSVTDPKRVAQLLASELTGLETGPLADVAVTDADDGATPSEDGTVAYAIAHQEEEIGRARLYPERVLVELDEPGGLSADDRLRVEERESGVGLAVASGVAVKHAVDAIRSAL